MPAGPARNNAALFVPYALPLLLYVVLASLPESWGVPRSVNYALRLLAAGGALAWGWSRYVSLRGPGSMAGSVALGVGAGVLGTALWLALKAPFYPPGGESWGAGAFALRLAASASVVPLFEELLFRGYVLRLALQWERARRAGVPDPFGAAFDRAAVDEVEPGAWTPLAVAIATLAFAAGHQVGEYPAAIGYGLLMAGLWVVRRDLLVCVVAHAVTNATLALWTAASGDWARW